MQDEATVEQRNPDVAYEHTDVSIFGVTATVIGTFVGTIIVVALLWFFFQFLRSQRSSIADVYSLPWRFQNMRTNPVLQRSPRNDLNALKEQQQRNLHGYVWTDRRQGLIGIPIERAIEMVGKQGLPPAESMPGLQLGTPSTGHRQTGFEPLPMVREAP